MLAKQSKDEKKSITPGRCLSKLEKYATERDLPGIRMQAAMLIAEFYLNSGQLKDALAVLQDASDITDSLGVKTLKTKINQRIREMHQLLREAEQSTKRGKSEF